MLPIIEIRDLSKRYRLGRAFRRTETFRELLQRKVRSPWAALRGQKQSNQGFLPSSGFVLCMASI